MLIHAPKITALRTAIFIGMNLLAFWMPTFRALNVDFLLPFAFRHLRSRVDMVCGGFGGAELELVGGVGEPVGGVLPGLGSP